MSEQPILTPDEGLPHFVEVTPADVADQPDEQADQSPYADEGDDQ